MPIEIDFKGYVEAGDGTKVEVTSENSPLESLFTRLKNLPVGIKTATFSQIGSMIVRLAQAGSPYRTGNLRENISYVNRQGLLEVNSEAIDPSTGTDYAPIMEFGGVNDEGKWVEPQPYFYHAVDLTVSEVEAVLGEMIEDGIESGYLPPLKDYIDMAPLLQGSSNYLDRDDEYDSDTVYLNDFYGGNNEDFLEGDFGSGEFGDYTHYDRHGGGFNPQSNYGGGAPGRSSGSRSRPRVERYDDMFPFPSTKSAGNKLIDDEDGPGFGDFGDAGYWLGRD